MYIKRLVLENIRSYNNQVINFPKQSILLSGDIGSGKSTILQSIQFALFGLTKKTLSGSSLLRHGSKEGSIDMTFKLGKKDIMIKRTLKRAKTDVKQTEGFLIIDGKKEHLTPVELKTRIFQLLNYPLDQISKKDVIYRYTVYTPQEEMKQILTEESEVRLNTLRKVFDIDKYKIIRENSQILAKNLRQESIRIQGYIQDLTEKETILKTAIKTRHDMGEEFDKVNIELTKHTATLNQEKQTLEKLDIEMKKLDALRNSLEMTKVRLIDCNNRHKLHSSEHAIVLKQLDNIETRLTRMKLNIISNPHVEKELMAKQSALLKLTETNAKLTALTDKIQLLTKDVDEAKLKDIPVLSSKIRILTEKVAEKSILEKNMQELDLKLKAIAKVTHNLAYKIESTHDNTKKILNLSNCPTCMQTVSEHYKDLVKDKSNKSLSENEQKLSQLKVKEEDLLDSTKRNKQDIEHLYSIEKELIKLKSNLESLEKNAQTISDKKRILANLREKRTILEKEKAMLGEVATLNKHIKTLQEIKKQVEENKLIENEKKNALKLIEEKKKRADDLGKLVSKETESKSILENQLKDNREKIELNEKTERIHVKQREDIQALSEKQKELQVKVSVLNSKLKSQETQIVLQKEELDKKHKSKQRLEHLQQVHNWLDKYFYDLMQTIEKQILAKAQVEFNSLFQRWFNLLMEDQTLNVKLDDDFSVLIEQDGYDTQFQHLSGGEKTSCALAYRLALNKVINEINSQLKTKNLLILDEPTDGFSTEQLDKIRLVLDELSLSQIILVSHESKIESYVDHVIRVEKRNHISVIS